MDKARAVKIFDKQARQYAARKEGKQLPEWRRRLLESASGRVLELAVGAGANFPYYPAGVTEITAVDFSEEMLKRSREAALRLGIQVEFLCSDNEHLNLPQHSFDTVVSTLSLCAYEDPLKVLGQMKHWCKPEGSILLLEHGISSSTPLSWLQRTCDPLLHRMYGCHYNRDIPGLVREAGLSIRKQETYWMGMCHLIWASPE